MTRYSKQHLQAITKSAVIASPMATPSSTTDFSFWQHLCAASFTDVSL